MTRFTLTAIRLSSKKKLFSNQYCFQRNDNANFVTSFKLLQLVFLLFVSLTASAQLGTYSFTGNGACPNQNPDVVSQPANATFSVFTSANTTCVSTTDIFDNENWNTTNSIDLTQYNEFTITPSLYYALNLNSISFSHITNEDAPLGTTWVLRSSIDNYATDIATGTTSTTIQTETINLSATDFSDIGAVTFRLYLLNANSANTIWSNDDVVITGNIVAISPANPGTPTSDSPQCASPGVTISSNGTPPTSDTWYWQTDASGTSTANSSSTYNVITSGTYYIRAQNNTTLAWSSGADSITVIILDDVTTPVFALGATSTRCEGAGTVTYEATSTNNTGITYSLDATSLSYAGNSINSSTGEVNYDAGWNGTSTITASAIGCNGPITATHIVTVTPTVGTPVFALGATSTTCQGVEIVTYSATASNATSITYSLDATSTAAGNAINATTGAVTFDAGWNGTTTITATATGCNGPTTETHTVTITSSVSTPVFSSGATSTRCQGAGTIIYGAAASNSTSITYSLDAASLAGGNTINSSTGEVNYDAGWNGTSTITASAIGCNGPITATHIVTVTPTVGTPVFALGTTSTRCQGVGVVTYSTTASNATGITYSLDATSTAAGNTINATTGAVTYDASWIGASVITASATGCNGPTSSTHTVTVTTTVGTPVFLLGSSSTLCQNPPNTFYTATASNSTSIVYSLDAASLVAGNSIQSGDGRVNYNSSWSGTTIITATAIGCNGPTTATHTVTITPSVSTPVFIAGATSTRCQGVGTVSYTATANNSTSITYSLDVISTTAGNTINSITGAVSYTLGWSGTSTITASAAGCNGPRTSTHTVTTNLPVSTPVFTLGATSSRCQGTGSIAYSATATHSTGITYSLDAASLTGGNTINASTGSVNYSSTWSGTSIITASAAGCYGPTTATHIVTINPPVTTPVFDLGTTSTRCQGASTVIFNATANNATGITYTLDFLSSLFGNTINSSTGAVTFTSGWSGSSTITARASGCNGPRTSTHTVSTISTVGTPSFSAGTTSTRCQGIGTITYTATASDNTGITYSLDATSLAAGIIINTSSGAVTYTASWSGTSVITATATGCNGPRTRTHTVTTTPTVGAPAFSLGATSVRCQGAATVSYIASASNATTITYSLDATTDAFAGNSINTSTGAVTYGSGWSGTSVITVTANGCNGPRTTTHTVTITPTVSLPVFASGTISARCQGTGIITYAATATNTTGISYSLDFASSDGGNTINAATGEVTYDTNWNGTTIISAIASGCNGPRVATHTVTVTATVGTPIFSLGNTSTRCQGAGSVNYTATASSASSLIYSLDATSIAGGNIINTSTGTVTYAAAWSGTSVITVTANGCNGPTTATHTVTITPTVGTPVFALGATTTRCQGAGTVPYTSTATNSTVITYSIDAISMAAGNTINSSTGTLTYVAGWNGTTTITARATGCNGPRTATHTVTITPTVGIPVFALGATSTRCQSAGTITYAATSTNNTGITYSLNAASLTAGNTINPTTGVITYTSAWFGTSVITATATGCNGPRTATHTVTITPNGSPSFLLGAASSRWQGAGTATYTATSNNGATISYSLDAVSLAAGNTISYSRGIVTYVAGWNGTSVITATVTGCNGIQTATHTVTTSTQTVTKQLYLSDPTQSLDRIDPVATNDATLAQTAVLSSTGTTNTTFTQNPAMCLPLTINASLVRVTNYVSITSGTMPANPAITALLRYGATNIISLTNPTYNSATGLLTWTGNLPSDITIPAGQAISLQVTTAQAGVTFRIEYDNTTKPSKIELPVSTYIDITSFNIHNAAYPSGSILTGGIGNSTYYGRINVTDPFGTSDINGVSVLMTPPGSTMNATQVATSGCTKTYEFAWSTPSTANSYVMVATAREGYENAVTDVQDLNFDLCTDCPPLALNDSASGAGGSPLPIDVLANDSDPNGNLNATSISIIRHPMDGSAFISNNQIIYVPNGSFSGKDTIEYQICDNTSPTPLCGTAFVFLKIDPTVVDICSDAPKTHVYYMPYPEQDVHIALAASGSPAIPSNNIETVISLTMPYPNMIVVWDEWEDGYEANYLSTAQTTTKIWGDGNPYNGIAPGYPNDIIPAGGGIVLKNTMNANPRNSSIIMYDGKDKITSSGQIAITQVCSEPSITSVQDIKTNVTSVFDFGQSFTIPVGEDFPSQDFDYTALFIRASENNTTVNIDKDNNGVFETTTTLNEGNSYFVNGGVLTGATVLSDKPIGVELNAGGIDNYSIRNAPIYPASWYSNVYYTPVPTSDNAADSPKDTSAVMLYNSLNRPINITWSSGLPATGTINLPAKTAVRFPLAYSTTAAYKFINPTGESFTAIEVVDSYTPGGGGNSGSSYDWAFNLISEPRLTDFATTAWAPGGLDLVAPPGPDVNGNPIWVTPTASTTIYVKYDGKVSGTAGTLSSCGLRYDVSYNVNALNYIKIKDPNDNDQSGIAIYTCNGVKLAAVYGEDPQGSTAGNSAFWDVGTTIQPFCRNKMIFANDDYAYTIINTPVTIPILKNDEGFLAVVDPSTVTTAGFLQPKNGTVTVNSNGTVLYLPNIGFAGVDTFEYRVCSTPSPVVCDIATVYVTVNACPAPASQNIISGMLYQDRNRDGINNDGQTGFYPGKVYLYNDGNCNAIIDANELTDSVSVDSSGTYQFINYPEKFVADNFENASGANTCATGSDGNTTWLSNWTDIGNSSPATGLCVSRTLANADVEIVRTSPTNFALRLKDVSKSATRTVNLSSATRAFLSFSYRRASATLTAGEDIIVQASTNGSTFGTIYTISGDGTTDANFVDILNQDISTYNTTATTYIRFLTNANVDEADSVFIDNVTIKYLKYPQCYITKVDSASITANYYLTSGSQKTFTAINAASCLSPYDFGIAKNIITLSGRLFNDINGLKDSLVNGTAIGSPSGSTIFAYLAYPSGQIAYKTTVNATTGVYSFPLAEVNTDYVLILSTIDSALTATVPQIAKLPIGWVSVGDAYGIINGAGAGIESGTPNVSVPVKTFTSSISNINFGIEQSPETAINVQATRGNPGGFTNITIPTSAFTTSNVGINPNTIDYSGGTVTNILIPAFPANANSITIGGVVYINGGTCPPAVTCTTWPVAGIILSAPAGVPAQTITVDPLDGNVDVVIQTIAIDNAGVQDTTRGSITIPFRTIAVSGLVWNDINGNKTEEVVEEMINGANIGAGILIGNILYANLIDATGIVIAYAQVQPNGTYTFPFVPQNTTGLTIQLSINQGVVGLAKPATTLTTGWNNTGENKNGQGGSADILNNGEITLTTSTSNISAQNFGIEQTPQTAIHLQPTRGNPGGFNTINIPASSFLNSNVGLNPNTEDYNGGFVTDIRIPTFPTGANSVTINNVIYTNGGACPPATTCIGWPSGGVTIPAPNGIISQTVFVDPSDGNANVVIPIVAIDNAGLEDPTPGNITIPFQTITVSGMVWNDRNGNITQEVSEAVINGTNIGAGIKIGSTLYMNLIDANGKVIASEPVLANGTYLFPFVPQNTTGLTLQLTRSQGTVGLDKPFTLLSAGWINTGENKNGQGGIPDSRANGEIPLTTAAINITAQNFGIEGKPIAVDDENTTNEDTPVSGDVSTNDTPSGDGGNTWTLTDSTSHGTVILNPNGTYTYTPSPNFNGIDTFMYSVCDIDNDCDTAIVVITVNGVNDIPIAVNDVNTTNEDTPVSGNASTNDTPSGDGGNTWILTDSTSHGTVIFNPDGTYTYTPVPNFNGRDTFTYQVCDIDIDCDIAIVVITVIGVNDVPIAVNDFNSTDEDTPVSSSVIGNDTPSGDGGNVWTLVGPNGNASNGTVSMNPDGSYTYTPNPNFNGIDVFTYKLCDIDNDCDTATVTITIDTEDDFPVAVNDSITTNEDTPVTNTVVNNDTPSGDGGNTWTTIGPNGGATNGTVSMDPNGTYTYTPNPNFFGRDSFNYQICDADADCSSATVYITIVSVDDFPIANADYNSTNEDTPITNATVVPNDVMSGDGGNVFNNSCTVCTMTSNGTLTFNADGTYNYTPNANFNGVDQFIYQLCDADGDCDTAIVSITVVSVDDFPIANADYNSTNEDTPITNATVVPNDVMSGDGGNVFNNACTVCTTTPNGTLTFNSNGTYNYTPNANFNGVDQFIYQLCDADGDCDTAIVRITVVSVDDFPIANADYNSTNEDTPITNATVVPNDVMSGDGGNVFNNACTVCTTTPNGTLTFNSNGTYNYTPNANFNGVDQFIYQLCDADGDCDTAIVRITVNSVDDQPIANADNNSTNEDTPITNATVVPNDVMSGDGGNVFNNACTVCTTTPNGTLTFNSNGTYNYTPNSNFNGVDQFIYQLCDADGDCDTAIVSITVVSVDDFPIANADYNSTNEDTPITNATVVPNDVMSGDGGNVFNNACTVCTTTPNGMLTFNSNGTYNYTPNANFNGVDQFIYQLCDADGDCDTALVTIIVGADNDSPIAVDDRDTTCEDIQTTGNVALNDIDLDGPGVSITTVSGPNHGSIILNTNGTYTYTPNANYNGRDTVVYSYCDLGTPNFCDTASLFILITPVNDSTATDQTVQCDGSGNAAQLAAWLASNGGATPGDSCYNCTWTNNFSGLSDGCGNTGAATVTFTLKYDCGTRNTTAVFTIEDTTVPTIDTPARDTTVECDGAGNAAALNAWLTANGNASASDVCSGSVTWTNNYTTLSDDCGATGSATVVFTATDACGNTSTTSAVFTIEDTTDPTIDTPARDTVVECDGAGNAAALNAWLASNGNASASDVCSGSVTWTNNYTTLSDDCGATGSATVVFTATDACGNTSTMTAVFTIEDTTDPTIDTPARDTTVECDGAGNAAALSAWLASNGNASASDVCSGSVTWTNNYTTLSDDCGATGSATVIFTATDSCGNSTTTTAIFTIEDTTSPTIDTPAQDATVECDGSGNAAALSAWLANNGNASASDVCSGSVTWTNNYTGLSDGCGNTGSATVIFTATDSCGNSTTTTATFTIEDTTAPTIDTPAQDATVECDGSGNASALAAWLSSNGGASASDICSGVNWTNNYTGLSDGCGNTGSATVIFTATDSCGNSTTTTATFTIEDTTAPTIDTPAQDATVECDGSGNASALAAWLSNNGGASASDICSGVSWTNNYTGLSDGCGNTGSATVIFTATDSCGNSTTTTATFTIEDTTSPTIDTPAQDATVECDGAGNASALAAWLSNNGGASASDICSGVSWTNNYTGLSDGCGNTGSATVIFTATDSCGNSTTTTATFTIEDTTAPTIDTPAQDATVECDGSGNAAQLAAWLSNNGGASASDICSGVNWTNNYTGLSDGCGNTGSATVIFTATDSCGNSTTTTAIFTIEDTTSPTIDTPAQDATVECDGSGNAAQLAAWLSSNGGASASDICSGVSWTNNYTGLSDGCGNTGSATVIFTATDSCGNSTTTTAIFTIEDTTVPTIDTPARDTTVECDGAGNAAALNAWLTANGNASASDVCSGSVTWTNNYTTLSDDCGATGSATVVFTATDACGNTSTTSAVFTIEDTTDPTIDTPARDTVVECDGAGNAAALNAWLASNGNASASDVCSGSVTWTNNYTTLSDDCGATGSATVVFTATDACGNTSTMTAVFTIEDTTDPTIDTPARDTTVECDGAGNAAALSAWLASNGNASASDVCSGSVTWTNNYTTLSDDCGATGSATVIFTATDSCGNSTTTTAIFTIEDTTSPTIDTPAQDATVECDGSGNAAALSAWLANNGNASASDVCSGSVTWTNNYTGLSDGCGNTGSATVIFTATDSCGNSTTTTATFTIEDTTAPTIDTPAQDATVECDGSGNASALAAWLSSNGGASASDICSGVNWTNNYTGLSDGCGNTGSATVIFTATDSCGNSTTTTATFTIEDTTAPTIDTPAQDATVECDGSGNASALAAWLSSNGGAAASDICSGVNWTNNYTGLSDGCGNTGSAAVIFTATDSCGNSTTTTATFTIEDTTAPTIDTPAQDATVECDGSGNASALAAWLSSNGGSAASDICSGVNWTNNYTGLSDGCGNTGSATVIFTATDSCGNSTTTTATFTIEDTTAPTIDTPAQDATVECDGSGNASALAAWLSSNGGAAASDICSGVNWTNNYTGLSDGCGNTGSATVIFTATDSCGNSTTTTATFTIEDTTAPTIDTPAQDATVECDGAGNASALSAWLANNGGSAASDICSGVNWTNNYTGLSDGCGNTGSATVIFTATDSCGNSTTTTAIFTIEDTTSPTIDTPAQDATVECDGAGNASALAAWLSSNGGASASDICSGVSWTNNYTGLSDGCGNTGSAAVIFTATDSCGNSTTTTATFTIEDTTAPTIDTPAQDATVECDGSGNASALAAWLSSNGGSAASDICSGVNWTNNYTGLSDGCGNTGSATVIFTATDSCGNSTTTTATFTIEDTTAPTIDTPAQDATVECDGSGNASALAAWLSSNGGAAASDICSGVNWTNNYTGLSDGCGNTGSATVIFTATDSCGNSTTTTATFTIEDTTAPTIDTPAQDATVECDGAGNASALSAWLANNGGSAASDICSGVSWTNNYTGLSDGCGNTGSAAVIFTATDSCGNSTTTTATFTIEDTTAPTIDTPAQDATVECDGAGNAAALAAWLSSNGGSAASDVCSGVSWTNNYTGLSDGCGNTGSATVIFTATDSCGNSTTTTATFTIEDTTAPTIDTPAQDATVECDGAGNASALAAWLSSNGGSAASDICSGVNWTNNYTGLSDGCGNTGSAAVIFTATDSCGNSTTTTATFTIEDTTAPTIDTPAQDATVECDGSGNASALAAWLSSNGGSAASDICSGVNWTNNYTGLSDGCGNTGSATVIFTATDSCGNSTTTTATFTIEDTTAPTIDTPAQDATVECDGSGNASALAAWLSSNGGAAASDICSGVNWTNNYTGLSDGCGNTGSATVIFTATDSCGNSTTTTATFTIEDTTAPTIDTPAQDATVECDGAGNASALSAWLANNGGSAASDICSGVNWTNNYTGLSDGCGNTGSATVIFTATDSCGNSTTTTAIFTIEDTTSPTIDTPAQDATVECDGAGNASALAAWLSSNGGASASDICSGVNWTNNYTGLSDGCGNTGSATVIFTATDSCGNSTTTTAIFTIEDTTSPTIDTPAQDATVECDGSGNAAQLAAWLSSNGGAAASDICSGVSWTNNYTGLSDGCGNTGSATVIFTATDSCGNSTTTTAIFTIEDTTSPTIDSPAQDATVECDGSGNAAQLAAWLSSNGGAAASDICSGVSWTNNYTGLSDGCGNTGSATVIFTATDSCGNSTSTTETFTIEDTTDPRFVEPLPTDEFICDQVTPPTVLTATDNCGRAIVAFTEVVDSLSQENTTIFIRTWTATDECGNSTVHNQEITVSDIIRITLDRTICEGETVIIGNNSYGLTGTYTTTFKNASGCDSIVTLNLTVNPIKRTNVDEVLCQGEQVVVGGQIFTTSVTNQIIILQTSEGCDSIITLNVIVNPNFTTTMDTVICKGESIQVGSTTFTTTGTYTIPLQSSSGCDSTVTLNLVVLSSGDTTHVQQTICDGETATVGGQTFTTAGTYYIASPNGKCTNIIELTLIVNEKSAITINETICSGESIIVGTQTFNTTGTYIVTTQNSTGCDSMITLNLDVLSSGDTSYQTQTICQGDTAIVNGQIFTTAGIHYIAVSNGICTNIIELTLNVNSISITSKKETICKGESIIVAGQTFTTPGIYNVILQNTKGCDSIIILDLTVNICVDPIIIRDTTIYDTLPVRTTITICDIVNPNVDNLEITACDGSTVGTTAHGTWTLVDSCLVFVAGPIKGTDTICIRTCIKGTDTCATTTVIITVTGLPPVAVNDSTTTDPGAPVTIPVLPNDTTFDEDPLTLCANAIVIQPTHGTVVVNQDGTITYTPITGYTGVDSFQYQICDPEGSDTAWVFIRVEGCILPNAFSPNGDGINDMFVIPCAEGDVVFSVYNRWGIEVYRNEKYVNDWDGNYKGSPLPDGTYYYVLKYTTSTGEEVSKAGFITLHR